MPPRLQLLSGTQLPLRPSHRTYAVAATQLEPVVKNPLRRGRGGDIGSHLPKHIIPADAYIPAYPYGDRTLFKQSNNGLYGHSMIRYGNNVSHKTETKTRRHWKPNVLNKAVYSVALKKKVKLRMTSKVLKVMDREGGLDAYLLKEGERRIKELGPLGWALRWTLMQRPSVVEEMRHRAAELGLPQEAIDAQWPTKEMLGRQKGLMKASEFFPDETAEEEQEQYDEDAELDEAAVSELSHDERRVVKIARAEYLRATMAADRYLIRKHVTSIEEGIKLAFIREKERGERSKQDKERFQEKLRARFSAEDVAATRAKFELPKDMGDDAVRVIAYNQWRRQEVEKFGSYEEWRKSVMKETNTALQERYGDKFGDPTQVRVNFANALAEAESASTNKALDAERKEYLVNALSKADRAIRARSADGMATYIDLVLQETREKKASVAA